MVPELTVQVIDTVETSTFITLVVSSVKTCNIFHLSPEQFKEMAQKGLELLEKKNEL